MAIATELIAKGEVNKTGVITPEEAFDPAVIFAELAKRQIVIHEEITELVAQS
jgi:saccharopine dehydrogenase-like NADP-dependent oxidoreductase